MEALHLRRTGRTHRALMEAADAARNGANAVFVVHSVSAISEMRDRAEDILGYDIHPVTGRSAALDGTLRFLAKWRGTDDRLRGIDKLRVVHDHLALGVD